MAVDLSGGELPVRGGNVSIKISENHPLIQLAGALPWLKLMEIVVPDLKKSTAKGFWYLGRKMKVRMHLGAFILQRIYNLTDRKTEYQIKDNAAFRLFCGSEIVDGWHPPDHTKIEDFRNRLSSETHRALANMTAKTAVSLGFGDPRETDFDSTVQEANIAYPSDASLMVKLAGMGKKLVDFVKQKLDPRTTLSIDMKALKTKAREYFFLPRNKSMEIKRKVFEELHKAIKRQMRPITKFCEQFPIEEISKLPWNIQRTFNQIQKDGWRYLLDVGHFVRTHSIKAGKILSFHGAPSEAGII